MRWAIFYPSPRIKVSWVKDVGRKNAWVKYRTFLNMSFWYITYVYNLSYKLTITYLLFKTIMSAGMPGLRVCLPSVRLVCRMVCVGTRSVYVCVYDVYDVYAQLVLSSLFSLTTTHRSFKVSLLLLRLHSRLMQNWPLFIFARLQNQKYEVKMILEGYDFMQKWIIYRSITILLIIFRK